ncbi:MAG TPA: hypothetical protein VJ739_17485 [Gemmataceae bacterium]|nr:hypothetical protein [Gemmataceae bacterium]
MPRPRPRLTPRVQQQICAFIRAGGFPYVAAEAAGVPVKLFERWLRRGREKDARPRYRAFAEAVVQAVAQARLAAELQVFEKRPLDWLKCGPGRETPERGGWTTAGKPRSRPAAADELSLNHPLVLELLRRFMELLTPFPDARAAVAEGMPELRLPPPS